MDGTCILKARRKPILVSESLRTFRRIVNERGQSLRKLPFQRLEELEERTESFMLGKRKAKVAIIVNHLPSGGVLVIVQGLLKKRFIPMVLDVAVDGFYKYPNETMAPMTDEDKWDYG